MSLINDALKKAQRQRTDEAADAAAVPGAARTAKGRPAAGSNLMILVGAGALALVGLSVGVTVFLLNRPASPPPQPAAAKTESPIAAEPPASSPMVSLPSLALPPASAATSIVSEPPGPPTTASAAPSTPALAANNATLPAPTVATTPDVASPAPPAASLPEPVEPPVVATVPPAEPDAGIYQYVDALRITGVKAAGTDSRVLMNDRVYRVNDIVERNLGLRLIKVESNALTFSDADGAMYVKNF